MSHRTPSSIEDLRKHLRPLPKREKQKLVSESSWRIPREALKGEEDPLIRIEKKGKESKEATHFAQSSKKPKAFKIQRR